MPKNPSRVEGGKKAAQAVRERTGAGPEQFLPGSSAGQGAGGGAGRTQASSAGGRDVGEPSRLERSQAEAMRPESGNVQRGKHAADTIKERYGEDAYQRIGAGEDLK